MRNQIRTTAALLSASLLFAGVGPSWAGSTISASFIGRSGGNILLSPPDIAGVVPQPYWANVDSGDPVTPVIFAPLLDNTGAFTSVQLNYSPNDSWNSDGPTVTPNDKMMKGIMKFNTTGGNIKIQNLPAGTYNVYAYFTENGTDAEGEVAIGTATNYVAFEAAFTGTFTQVTGSSPGNPVAGDYALWSAVPAAADGTITISAIKTSAANDGIGVAGIQVVQVSGAPYGINTNQCSITTQPTGTLALEGNPVSFTVGTSGARKIQWQRNGFDIVGAINPTYSTTATLADNNASYTAVVYNNINTNTSTAAILLVDAVTPPVLTQGFMTIQRWDGLDNATGLGGLDELRGLLPTGATPTSPSLTFYVAGPNVVDQGIDNFGGKVSGWVVPDVSGDYDFFLTSDDSSELFLNPTAAASGTNTLPNPVTDVAIAWQYACCNAFAEPSAGQSYTTQSPIPLQAGKMYGFVAIYKEGGGGDNLRVAWRQTTDPTPATQLIQIPAGNCWTMATSAGHRAAISTQPLPTVVTVGKNASFTAAVTTLPVNDPYSVQWSVGATPIAGANSTGYSTPAVTLADDGKQYKASFLTLAGTLTTTAATLQVINDTNPPVVLAAAAFPSSTLVGVTFDENLDPVTAGTPANYKVNGVTVLAALVRTNVANELSNEKNLVQLTVATPLTAAFTVTVSGVKDLFNNTMVPSTINGQVLGLKSVEIGSPNGEPGGPDPIVNASINIWGPGAFDVLCGGNDIYNNADGFNFLYEPKTNSFDVKVRVVSVSPIDSWSAGAIEVREGPVTTNGGGWELARHYFSKVDYSGPDATIDNAANTGAKAYEYNGRLANGDPLLRETSNNGQGGSRGWGGTGPGNPGTPPFPNAWMRIARVKNGASDHLLAYSSSDGVVWSLRQDVDLNDSTHAGFLDDAGNPAGPWPDVCYVGMGSTAHNNTINDGTIGSFWYSQANQPYQAYVIYRDYGDFVTPGAPTLSLTKNGDGTITLTYTGALYSSTAANGVYTKVTGASSPYTVNPKTAGPAASFYQAGP